MAIYRYLAGKTELYAVMIEAAVGEPPNLDTVAGGWRAKLEVFAEELSAAWDRHPWLPWATIGDRMMGPKEVGWIERAIGALDGTGLDAAERLDAVFVLCGHIRTTQSMTRAGTQPWTTDRRVGGMQTLLDMHSDQFPALTATLAAVAGTHHDNGREFGLRRILDGLEMLISQRSVTPLHAPVTSLGSAFPRNADKSPT